MQTRKLPVSILLSLLITLTLLFGGWFLYTKLQVEEPIRKQIGQMTSVKLADMQVGKEQLMIDLNVVKPESFPGEYIALLQTIRDIAPDKKVQIELANQDPELKKIWSEGVFRFTEAVDLHEYSKIPTLLNSWKTEHHLDTATASMDDNYIYVFLKRDKAQYFTIIPRTPLHQEVISRG